MKQSESAHLRNLGAVVGLGLLLAAACSEDPENTSSTGASTSTSTGSSTSAGGGGGSGGGEGGSGGGEGGSGGGSSSSSSSGNPQDPMMSFFVTSTGGPTANLGGLAGADKRCQDLAEAAGAVAKTWRAYLSVEKGANGQPEHAKDRIGTGPWYNAKLVMVAADVAELHTKSGDYTIFIDEKGEPVPGQWAGSPKPNQHDILTGTNLDGTLVPGKTCADWTSEDPGMAAWVGHSDGLGPMMSMDPMYRPWNSVHENGGCHDTAPKGGGGRIYCFAVN
jgi:hypothetical protein